MSITIDYCGNEEELKDKLKTAQKICIYYRTFKLPNLNNSPQLIFFSAYHRNIKTFPSIDKLINLKQITAFACRLIQFPSIDPLPELMALLIGDNRLKQIQEHIQPILYNSVYGNDFPKWLNYKRLISIDS